MLLDLFRKDIEFYNIHGHDDMKDLVRRPLDSYENYNLLLCGPPASAKTLFLEYWKAEGVSISMAQTL